MAPRRRDRAGDRADLFGCAATTAAASTGSTSRRRHQWRSSAPSQIDGADVAWDKEDIEEEDGDIGGVRISFPRITGDDPAAARRVSRASRCTTTPSFVGRVFDTQRPQNLPQPTRPGRRGRGPRRRAAMTCRSPPGSPDKSHLLSRGCPGSVYAQWRWRQRSGHRHLRYRQPDRRYSGVGTSLRLAGRLRRVLYSDLDISGRYQRVWDGADDNGQMLSPGSLSRARGSRCRYRYGEQDCGRAFGLLIFCAQSGLSIGAAR